MKNNYGINDTSVTSEISSNIVPFEYEQIFDGVRDYEPDRVRIKQNFEIPKDLRN